MKHKSSPDVKKTIAGFPKPAREIADALRQLIVETASELEVAELTESLKWGHPSFAASKGTPLRIGPHKSGDCALFAHCQSSVISTFAQLHGHQFKIDGNRAVILQAGDHPPLEELRPLIAHALTYKM